MLSYVLYGLRTINEQGSGKKLLPHGNDVIVNAPMVCIDSETYNQGPDISHYDRMKAMDLKTLIFH